MRIPSGKTDQVIYFVAVDSTDLKTRETGLSSFTVYRSRNGGAATAYTTPTVTELSSANMPGVYSLLIDEDTTIASTSDSEEYVVHITQAAMAPVTRTIELYRYPVSTGTSLVLQSNGRLGSNAVDATAIAAGAITSTKFATDAITATVLAADAASEVATSVWASGTRTLTSSLDPSAATIANAVWDLDATAHQTQGTFGQAIGDPGLAGVSLRFLIGTPNVDLASDISSLSTTVSNVPGNVWEELTADHVAVGSFGEHVGGLTSGGGSGPTAAEVADAVWDEATSGHTTASTFGKLFNDNVDTTISSRLATSGYTAPLDAAGTRTAIGLASANLDTQLDTLPTANENADALLDRSAGVETGLTLRQWLRLAASVLFGKASGLATTTAVFRDFGDTKARVTATVDADGNRSAVTTDAT